MPSVDKYRRSGNCPAQDTNPLQTPQCVAPHLANDPVGNPGGLAYAVGLNLVCMSITSLSLS
uniref:Uncharacterized protein n=1 Tax=Physcomitrium patens TaxID=3218 RepID=A0A2K1IHS5_PHYPA|nr:hypothetical protein PHYPA_027524 [Physcomitrium patens]